jgi:hypothetical protein
LHPAEKHGAPGVAATVDEEAFVPMQAGWPVNREKRGVVDRAIEDGGSREAVQTQARDDRARLPVPARRVIAEAEAAGAAPIPSDQIGGHATLVEKDVVARVGEGLPLAPPPPLSGDVGPALFVRVYRFF